MSSLWFSIAGGLLAMIGWGVEDFFAKSIVEKAGSKVTLFWTQLISLVIIVLFLISSNNYVFDYSFVNILTLLLLGFVDFLAFYFFWKALELNKVSIIGPFISSYSVFSAIISALVFKEGLSVWFFILVGLAIFGLSLAMFESSSKESRFKIKRFKGMREVAISLFCFSIFYPFFDNRLEHESNWMMSLLVVRIGFAVSALVLNLYHKTKLLEVEKNWFVSFFSIAFCNILAYIGLTWALAVSTNTSLTVAISSAYSIPTIILARFFLKEKLTKIQFLGVAVAIAGIVFLPFA